MKVTRQIMGMPVTIIIEDNPTDELFDAAFALFTTVDEQFSPYKHASEVTRINAGLPEARWSPLMQTVVRLCRDTTTATQGYFNAWHDGLFDPSGLVKGWAINRVAELLRDRGCRDFYVEAGGDIQTQRNGDVKPWQIGIRNPFDREENVKILGLTTQGVATSGLYIRGAHIYDPFARADLSAVASLTVIGPNIYQADRFATAAFAMGAGGINFIESVPGLEGYQINSQGLATMTTGFNHFERRE